MNTGSFLNKTIKWLTQDNKFYICIHDISGILHNNPQLRLPVENMVHGTTFCNTAKLTSKGMRMCLKCKSLSIRKAVTLKKVFIGHCYLGITEIIKPVFLNETPLCIIYLGNLCLEGYKDEMLRKIKRNSRYTGVKTELLLNSVSSLDYVDRNRINEYMEILDILEYHIRISAAEEIKYKNRSSLAPAYYSCKSWIIKSIQNHILNYSNRELKLSHLAGMYFINPQYLCRLFKKETGVNFSEYVNNIRIRNAKKMLELTDDTIANISFQAGFNNVTYFNRLFKKIEGLSPSEYRALKQNDGTGLSGQSLKD